jgi:hypothetical protein
MRQASWLLRYRIRSRVDIDVFTEGGLAKLLVLLVVQAQYPYIQRNNTKTNHME